MPVTLINPESLGATSGYSHGQLTDASGKLLFISEQIAWNEKQKIVSDDFAEQFDRTLANVVTVVRAAGAQPEHIVRLVVYVTNKNEYRARMREVCDRYRKHMRQPFQSLVLVDLAGLLDDLAI